MTLDRAGVRELASQLTGELLLPDDAGYEERRHVWNRMIDRHPALIARCTSANDARLALLFARQRGLPISIRGGGHNVSGSAVADGGVVIDHSLRRSVRVEPEAGLVEVEPGALLGDLDRATAPLGLAVPMGIQTTTGVAGLTLGGGIGWLMRREGLACDHLVAADVLTADGELLTVSEEAHADLLWGLRGGGGNFGIVTRFVFSPVRLGPEVLAGVLLFPIEEAASVLRQYRDWAAGLPDVMTTIAVLRTVLPLPIFPASLHGRRVVVIAVCHAGNLADGAELISPVHTFGSVQFDAVAPKPFSAHQQMFDSAVPPGLGYYWKSHFMSQLSDAAIDVLLEHDRQALPPWSFTNIFQLGGAISRVASDATAYAERDAAFAININGVAEDPADDADVIATTRATFDALAPHSSGGVYVNFLGNEGEERVRAAYGQAYDRLAALKQRYDPDNAFRSNQNIRPREASAAS
ncbi:MAG: FAD-binding oxidoreductase [Chloroflexi bacterium]|nr:MAG: FAD-binding oxidoreductase [Chloroflexota bacterium]